MATGIKEPASFEKAFVISIYYNDPQEPQIMGDALGTPNTAPCSALRSFPRPKWRRHDRELYLHLPPFPALITAKGADHAAYYCLVDLHIQTASATPTSERKERHRIRWRLLKPPVRRPNTGNRAMCREGGLAETSGLGCAIPLHRAGVAHGEGSTRPAPGISTLS